MSSLELSKNPYVVALAGKEGAEKLSDLADKYKRKPYLYGFSSVDEQITKVSSLDSELDVDRLNVSGSCLDDFGGGFAFGLRNTSEASSVQKYK